MYVTQSAETVNVMINFISLGTIHSLPLIPFSLTTSTGMQIERIILFFVTSGIKVFLGKKIEKTLI